MSSWQKSAARPQKGIRQADGCRGSLGKGLAKQRGLSRGLSSLLGDAGAAAAMTSAPLPAPHQMPPLQSGLVDIPIEWINSGP